MLRLAPYLVHYINMRALSLVEKLILESYHNLEMNYILTSIISSDFKLRTCFLCADNIYLLYQCVSQFVALKLKCH